MTQQEIAIQCGRLAQQEGLTGRQIAERMNLPLKRVYYLMTKHGFAMRAHRTEPAPPAFLRRDPQGRSLDDVIMMRRAGWSWGRLAQEFGVSTATTMANTVRHHCRRTGREWPITTVD